MLASQAVLKRQISRLKCRCMYPRHFTQTLEERRAEVVQANLETRLSPLAGKQPKREPFAKNLFVGKFDEEFLTYPEVQSLERQQQYFEWLRPLENFVEENVNDKEVDAKALLPREVTDQLKEFGIYGARISERYKGIGLNATEFTCLLEVVGKSPSLGAFLTSHAMAPLETILRFGSEQQKNEYLPRLATGELIATICITENQSGSNLSAINAKATLSECGKYWKLNGEKILVANGSNANLFIVIAQCFESDDIFNTMDKMSVFIVERKHGGVSNEAPMEKLGQRGLETCSVHFTDTFIPKENILGEVGEAPQLLVHLLNSGRQNVGAQATVTLRNFMKALTSHVVRRKHFNKQMNEFQSVQEIIAKMASSLYVIESMTYLTTGIMDRFEDQDCTMERAMVEAFASRECVNQIYKGLQLFGARGYLKENPHEQTFRDALALTLFDGSNTDMNMFIALMGLQHAGKYLQEYVKQYRNPLMYPGFVLKQLFSKKQKLNLGLDGNLHPSLRIGAYYLEECLSKLQVSSRVILSRNGSQVGDYQMELRRLAEIATDVYAMTAVLGRSSRSYCIGLRNGDDEILLANTFCIDAYCRVERIAKEIEDGPLITNDNNYKRISEAVFRNAGYSPVHPLTKNF